MTIELSRRIKTSPSGIAASPAKTSLTARIDAKIFLGAKLPQKQRQGILEAADNCHITKSVEQEMRIVCSLAFEGIDFA